MKTIITTAAAVFALTGAAHAAPVVIDFEDQVAGTTIATQYDGVTISGTAFGAMIFDSGNVTGGDRDLGAPFTDADGAVLDPGNILIVSEDGDASDPDDRGAGGTITLIFDESVTFEGFNVFDIDRPEMFTAAFYGAGDRLLTTLINETALGNNGFETITGMALAGVLRAEFTFSGSGAIDDLAFDTAPVPLPAAGFLFAGGIAAMGAARRRRAA